MHIDEMPRFESIAVLARMSLGRLACAHDGQPYITPVHYAYDADCFYVFTTFGKKVEWMRANPLVCMEVDELRGPQEWATVVVTGRYEELPDTPEFKKLREHAHALLQRRPMWWEPAGVKTALHGAPRVVEPVYFRVHIDDVSGHRAVSDAASAPEHPARGAAPANWLQRLFGWPENRP